MTAVSQTYFQSRQPVAYGCMDGWEGMKETNCKTCAVTGLETNSRDYKHQPSIVGHCEPEQIRKQAL